MSNARVADATIKGLHGPYFDGLEPIQRLFRKHPERINGTLIETFEEQWRGNDDVEPFLPVTTDGYEWESAAAFRFYNRHVQLLFPRMQDEHLRDGTFADRHVALYYQGRAISPMRLDRLLRLAAVNFENAYEGLYSRILP